VLIKTNLGDHLIGHIATDSTVIEARERPVKIATPAAEPTKAVESTEPVETAELAAASEPAKSAKPKRKRGRPRKGEEPPPAEPTQLQRQRTMTVPEMVAELPKHCNVGCKCDSKGYKTTWIGYKLHIDTADGDIPVSCLLTSASVHDSQVAIPLIRITGGRVTYLYDVKDKAYDAAEIREESEAQGHVPLIATNPRRKKEAHETEERAKRHANYQEAHTIRYNQRSSAERVNSNLKDNYGAKNVRVRGHAKVYCHLMFGVLACATEQLMRLVTPS
jgi:hypothetical protein